MRQRIALQVSATLTAGPTLSCLPCLIEALILVHFHCCRGAPSRWWSLPHGPHSRISGHAAPAAMPPMAAR